MKNTLFTPILASPKAQIAGGFSAGAAINPSEIADKLFGSEIPGPWLTCYMLRRFGWPNEGSDPHKNLCTWTLTTPIKGLFLSVTPYLGGSNLHFGVRYSKEVGVRLMADPGRKSFFDRKEKAVMRWWRAEGRKLYIWGLGAKEGDPDELVHLYAEAPDKPGAIYGLWRRTPKHKEWPLPKWGGMFVWWLADFIEKRHRTVRLPNMTKREFQHRLSGFHVQAIDALGVTMTDLLRPTNIRDLSFNAFGDIERTPTATKHCKGRSSTAPFPGAGCTPEYWFGLNDKKRREYLA